MTRLIGFIPARMASSRFPGKPLFPILGRPMLEHVWRRASLYSKWDQLIVCTCDEEIARFAATLGAHVSMTAVSHIRALDRVAEAAAMLHPRIAANDVVVCVQADEPMLHPEMIDAVCEPLLTSADIQATVLGLPIFDEAEWRDPNTVKIVHDERGDILYTSRAPIPYAEKYSVGILARRIGGILGFKNNYLQLFKQTQPTHLELVESCDSNRLCGNGLKQRMTFCNIQMCASVDTPADIERVERRMRTDVIWHQYRDA